MNIVIQKLILFLIVFTIIYLGYYIFVIRKYNKSLKPDTKPKKKKKTEAYDIKERVEILFLTRKYNINVNKLDMNQLLWDIAFVNSFIMSTTVVVIGLDFIKGYIWKLLLGFVILIPLILLGYYILGKKYKRIESRGNKNV